MNDLRFDWFPAYDSDVITQLASDVVAEITDAEDKSDQGASAKKRQARQMEIAVHLLSALYTAHTNNYLVSMPLRTKQYSAKGEDQRKVQYSYGYTKALYDLLLSRGWIDVCSG